MSIKSKFPIARLALMLCFAFGSHAIAQDGVKPKAQIANIDKSGEADVARYCGNISPTAAEAKVAYQTKRLVELEARIKLQIEEFEKKEASAREWVIKRDIMMKSATEDVVAIYSKMPAEAAATQIADMDDSIATAILSKLKPGAASAILGEMEAEKAAKLAGLMAAVSAEDKKS